MARRMAGNTLEIPIRRLCRWVGKELYFACQLSVERGGMGEIRATKVLVVDDDATICQILRACLQDHGFEVQSAGSGEEAMAAFATEVFRVVITDIMMAGMDGHEVTRLVKKSSPQTQVVVITGADERQEEARAYRNGADGFLAKPFDMGELLEELNPVS